MKPFRGSGVKGEISVHLEVRAFAEDCITKGIAICNPETGEVELGSAPRRNRKWRPVHRCRLLEMW